MPGESVPSVLPYRVDVPESIGYRVKRALLGPPLVNARLHTERLSKPVALGVLAPDCVSSSAYGTEEILRILVPVVGAAAFALVLPVTGAILFVLLLLTLSYRDVVVTYTRAGGSYVVARENFGLGVAQVAAVALLIDYVVTVAVQSSAGTDAVLSVLHLLGHSPDASGLVHYKLEITIGVVLLLCYGNLRGIREAGRLFALPLYLFAFSVGLVIIVGLFRALSGDLPEFHPGAGALPLGHGQSSGLLYGASLFIVLRAFANGGASLTGLEAISNGVSAFREPQGPNARRTLVIMSCILALLVGGVSLLAHFTHAIPYAGGSPTVIAQEARVVFGSGTIGSVLFVGVQIATALILYTGGNTSFNGFPFLASFVAEDRFLPRSLTHRGHRLAFSNGIITLTIVSIALLLATGSSVDKLIAFYAIGVFTGFTMAAAGMVKHHWDRRSRRRTVKLVVNGAAAILSALVVVIFAVTKFTEGAWLVVAIFPIGVWALIRLNRRYRAEAAALDAAPATEMLSRPRTIVLVLVDGLDLAVIKALGFARGLRPADLRAVHFMIDNVHAKRLRERWDKSRAADVPLEIIECADRRVTRAAMELAARSGDERTEVTVLLPRRIYSPLSARLLHDRTADEIAHAVSKLPNAAAMIVPFDVMHRIDRKEPRPSPATRLQRLLRADLEKASITGHPSGFTFGPPIPIKDLHWRRRATIEGRVRSVYVGKVSDAPFLQCEVYDGTGGVNLVFFGRRGITGLEPGVRIRAEGMVGDKEGTLAISNPAYVLLPEDQGTEA